ncbi:potassium channel family protein [Paenibacillus humicola]|uniref:potassium channel family protein n=1 Tax=Paenibacillus humicola TaxID=3110540 RepID=UPI00237A80AC|nr:potassium channel family protein [Paenibacillus humicola]
MIIFANLLLRLIRMNNVLTYGAVVLVMLCGAGAAYALEPDTFGSYFNGLWWVMTTVTTVGFGDYYPHTVPGKCLGMVLYIFGIGLLSLTISKIVDAMLVYERRMEEGKVRFMGEKHFVIINWSTHAEIAVREIMNTDQTAEIVLIDMMDKAPFQHIRMHYIRGNPVRSETLDMANLGAARAVFIFADDLTHHNAIVRDPSFIDGKSLLVAAAVEREYKQVHTVVEIKDEVNLPSFRHIKIDDFIIGTEAVSHMAVRSAFNPGTSRILSQLLSRGDGDDLFEIERQPRWATFGDAFDELLKQGATLISNGSDLGINKRMDEPIPHDARLFVICTRETFEKLQKLP